MTTYGDFQSIFQLAAGLTLGVSGVLTLFEDPIDKESRRITRLSKISRRLLDRHRDLPELIKNDVNILVDIVEDAQEDLSVEAESDDRFRIVKYTSFIASVIGLWLLIYSSDHSPDEIKLTYKILSYFLLAYVPIAVIYVAWVLRRVGLPFEKRRLEYEQKYLDLVNRIWDSKGKIRNEGSRMGQI